MSTSPLVSIIIPVYNVESYLKETLSSVCKQTYLHLEILCIDDGSTDLSGKICDEFAMKDHRIKVIHKPNGGVSSARNVGLEMATGEYISFVDSDDIIEKEMIEVLLQEFNKHDDLGIVCSSPVYRFEEEGDRKIYKEEWNIKKERKFSYKEYCINILNHKCNTMVWGKIYRKSLLKNIRFWEEICGDEDTLFMYELTFIMKKLQWKVLELPFTFYSYRFTPNSITNYKIISLGIDSLKNINRMKEATTDKIILDTLQAKLYNNLYSLHLHLLFEPGEQGENLRKHYMNHYHNILKKVNLWDVYQKTSLKLAIKYLLSRNKILYYHLYKWTLYKKYQKGHSF